ncbi:MAG: sulfur oxidation c-type cytochrome SoxX [Beijerinckiaceae bacterium]
MTRQFRNPSLKNPIQSLSKDRGFSCTDGPRHLMVSLSNHDKLRVMALGAMFTLLAGASPALAQSTPKLDDATLDRYVASIWSKVPEDWKKLNTQDETQKICSATANQPTEAQAKTIQARELAAVKFPTDGVVAGDWKKGQQVAQRGSGGQFSDQPDTFRGGNCYACHQLSKGELSYGTLGPSLLEYGKQKGFKPEEARATFAKIWNAQSMLACSTMPRFGHNGFLTEAQIKDAVAYLFDPESPVNK